MKLSAAGKKGALSAIMYHELGHTLLNLWGLPGFDNEETVDEFAVVMLYLDGRQEYALEFMEYFEKNNPWIEARMIIERGGRHPISSQRIRNVRRILSNPGPVIERWNRLLYPHMTVAGLENVLKTAPRYADRALAEKLIAEKSARREPPPQN
ncbi:MAG: hypothetical protein RIB80_18480 [Rhodospirillales bacterium]